MVVRFYLSLKCPTDERQPVARSRFRSVRFVYFASHPPPGGGSRLSHQFPSVSFKYVTKRKSKRPPVEV